MDFKKGADYTRDEIHNLYFGRPLPRPKKGSEGTGNWYTGYVRPKDTNDLIVFMNIGVAGRTGHDFPNKVKYESSENIITWHGKPGSHSKQETFKMILKLTNKKSMTILKKSQRESSKHNQNKLNLIC